MPTRSLRPSRVAIAGVAAAAALAACVPLPPSTDPEMPCGALTTHPLPRCSVMLLLDATEVRLSQTQAVQGFDDGDHVVTDPAALDELDEVVDGRLTGDATLVGGCPGGRTTRLEIDSASLGTVTVVVDTCASEPLAHDLDDLVTRWHEEGVATPAP